MAVYLRTNYRLTGGTPDMSLLALSGVIVQGSFNSSATSSGYVTVTHNLGEPPRSVDAYAVYPASSGLRRQIYLKSVNGMYATFVIASNAQVSSMVTHLVWHARL